jgi:hypothetical protein
MHNTTCESDFFAGVIVPACWLLHTASCMGEIKVECYAGYKADQRPLRFTLGGNVFTVENVEDQWYSPSAIYFRVRANDGNLYILRHDENEDSWTLDAFRAGTREPRQFSEP